MTRKEIFQKLIDDQIKSVGMHQLNHATITRKQYAFELKMLHSGLLEAQRLVVSALEEMHSRPQHWEDD